MTEKQVRELKQTAETLKEAADNILSIISNGSLPVSPSRPKLIRLLSLLDKAGGTVTKDEYHKLGAKAGYTKGDAAPFAYPPNNTVTWLSDDRVGLTPKGKEKIAKYSDWLATQ